jgi:hypothetical protein
MMKIFWYINLAKSKNRLLSSRVNLNQNQSRRIALVPVPVPVPVPAPVLVAQVAVLMVATIYDAESQLKEKHVIIKHVSNEP